MEKENKDAIKALEQEKNELNALIGKGVSFEVDDIEFEVKKVFFGLLKKRVPIKVTRKFKVEEPTLGTLDRIAAESIELAIDDEALKSSDGMKHARTLVAHHSKRCAKIIALAVLDSDYLIPKPWHGGVKYVEDTKRIKELTSLFSRTIKPSKLYQLYVLINAMCNLGDFTNSIRLMSSDRTTMPILVEQEG